MGLLLEMELGVTGGEEDGVDNSGVKQEDLYSKPEEIFEVYSALTPIAPKGFSIAAAFGNVHGVYSPGNVKLTPSVREKGARIRLGWAFVCAMLPAPLPYIPALHYSASPLVYPLPPDPWKWPEIYQG